MAAQNPTPMAIYRQLGKSGLRVSVPILGAMHFGDSKQSSWKIDEAEALPLLKAAYDRGINTWDTANIYSDGLSEVLIGKTIKKYNIPRQKLVIMTKCYFMVKEKDHIGKDDVTGIGYKDTVDYVNQTGLSRQAILNSVDASLRRLDTDYIDVLQIHRFDVNVPIEETMKALHDLVQSGKVRYIGASSMRAVRFASMQFCAEKNGWTKFISMQNKYNLLYREEERDMNFFCHETGVALIPWAPLDTGRLAKPVHQHQKTERSKNIPDLTSADQALIDRVEELSTKKGWIMSQVALAWLNPLISSPIIGFSSTKRMDEALEANSKHLTDQEVAWLEELYQPRAIDGFQTSDDPKYRRKEGDAA